MFRRIFLNYFTYSQALSDHVIGIEMLVQATQIALSATLAAFCCKVIQCCSPRSNVVSSQKSLTCYCKLDKS